MDITLERMLSLIPKKPNGEFVHGAKKEFCEKIGAPTNIISQWENGSVKSYVNYVSQVAANYPVSVEWLLGQEDQNDVREKLFDEERILLNAYRKFSAKDKEAVMAVIKCFEEKYE